MLPTAAPAPAPRAAPDRGQTDAIVAAAEACFARSGYARASMREIAATAGVSKSLLHYHFASKEQLFVEAQMRAYERLAARVHAAAEPIATGKDRGLLAFDALVASLRESNDMRVQAELWAAALSDPTMRAHVVRLRSFFRELLARSIEELLGRDLARLGVTPAMAADLVWSLINGAGVELAFGAPPERAEQALQAFRAVASIALDAGARRAPARKRPEPPATSTRTARDRKASRA